MENKLYAEIIVDNTSSNTDKVFTYGIPKEFREKIDLGMRVLVPFGRGNKLLEGIVLKIVGKIDFNAKLLKNIESLVDESSLISKDMLELSEWIKDEYLCSHIEVLKTMMPTGITNKSIKYVRLNEQMNDKLDIKTLTQAQQNTIHYLKTNGEIELENLKVFLGVKSITIDLNHLIDSGIIDIIDRVEQSINKKYEKYVLIKFKNTQLEQILKSIGKSAFKQRDIINYLSNIEGTMTLRTLMAETDSSLNSVRALEDKGYLEIEEKIVDRLDIASGIEEYKKIKLSPSQKVCVDTIYDDYIGGENKTYLLHGVTGSGKTEVYLQLIEKMLDLGKQAIVLVPEISLTPQTVDRFVGRFGDNVAVLHSRLSLGERYDEWRKIKSGRVQIAVGARSAVFAPFSDLGIIIIDEEHEDSYKSSRNPKYDTIAVSEKRCEIEGGILLLGSATPSIDTFFRAKKGEMELLSLPERANKKEMPPIEVVDMKVELQNGNKTIFSEKLYEGIVKNLKEKQQTILFLNRRGFSTFVSCRACGFVLECDSCDISLTYHNNSNNLRCHYCGLSKSIPRNCPECGSTYLKHFGIGTQQIEEIVKTEFPEARVSRMDVDTTSKKGSHEKILNAFKRGETDILVGTQMIAKGLDFPNVTLVGIIAADTSLNLPDFRASERTFQLLTQVGGRTGRGELDGTVVLQTYEPDHYSIEMAKDHDYLGFYEKEIKLREAFGYPPFSNIINLVFSSKDERAMIEFANKTHGKIVAQIKKNNKEYDLKKILGPNPSLVYKVKDRYRYQILLKCEDDELTEIKKIIKKICIIDKGKIKTDVNINIDVNPTSIL